MNKKTLHEGSAAAVGAAAESLGIDLGLLGARVEGKPWNLWIFRFTLLCSTVVFLVFFAGVIRSSNEKVVHGPRSRLFLSVHCS